MSQLTFEELKVLFCDGEELRNTGVIGESLLRRKTREAYGKDNVLEMTMYLHEVYYQLASLYLGQIAEAEENYERLGL